MKIYLLSFFCLLVVTVKAQTYSPFPTKNALWAEKYYPGWERGPSVFHFFALKDNDTTINGNLYHKLYHSTDTVFTEDKLCGGLRELNKKIYYYSIKPIAYSFTEINVGAEVLLYDFSLNEKDTIRKDTYRISYPSVLLVNKIDSLKIESGYRKCLHFGLLDATVNFKGATWAEGIGSLRGMLFATGAYPNNGLSNDLICFRQDNKILFHNINFKDCYYTNTNTVAISNIYDKPHVKVSPNPLKTIGLVEFEEGKYGSLKIINMFGVVVREFNIQGLKSLNISRDGLPDGFYFLMLIGKPGNNPIVKVFIE